MRKRVLSLITAVVLVLAMGITATAAGSVSVNGVVTGVASAKDKNGNDVRIVVSAVKDEDKAIVDEVRTAAKLKELLGDAYVDTMSVIGAYDVRVVGEGEIAFPVTVTFNVSGIKASSKIATLHYDTNKGAWEVLNSTAGEGTITAVFNSLSPVAFVADKNTTDTTVSGATTGKSPQTNGTTMAVVLAVIALAAAGSVVYLAKRKNIQA